MKKTILGIAILALTSATACQQTTTNTNANSAKSNQTGAVNSNAHSAAANHDSMNMSSMNHNSMNHSMMHSSPNAASAPYDLQFLDTMVHHHQGAVEMAKTALQKTQNAELRKFAENIVADQNKEIRQMKEWRDKWYAGRPAAMNMEMPGMSDSMKMMTGDEMKKWEATTGKEFDVLFLEMMTPHHAGAVTMSQEALQKAEHAEIKTLSNQIIKAQEAEIKQMANWKAKWSE